MIDAEALGRCIDEHYHRPGDRLFRIEVLPEYVHVYDEAAVVAGTRDGTAIINDIARLADYRGLFDQLTALASFDDAARDVMQLIAHDYRSLLSGDDGAGSA